MTKQETFDTVVRGLLKQGRQSSTDWPHCCLYRQVTEDGVTLKCAAGMLIPDEKYDPRFEGVGIYLELGDAGGDDEIMLRNTLIEGGHDLRLVKELQQVHDRFRVFAGSMSWKAYLWDQMGDLAERWGLFDDVLREQG